MQDSDSPASALDLIGGELCVDFVNTVEDRKRGSPEDRLKNYSDLVAWSGHVGTIDTRQAHRMAQAGQRRAGEAESALVQARELREALYRILTAVADEQKPRATDLARLNAVLGRAMSRARVAPSGDGYALEWPGDEETLDSLLYPVARSAAELLTSERLTRIRECEDETCGWLFVDTSKNRSRRWCSMESCGNRAKARRHYRQQKSSLPRSG